MTIDETKKIIELPEAVPVLPVRNTVLFPNAAVPLIVGRIKSVRAIKEAQKKGDLLLVVAQKDPTKDDPGAEDLFSMGVVALISKINRVEKDSYQLVANGLFRFRIENYIDFGDFWAAKGTQIHENPIVHKPKIDSLSQEIKQVAKSILGLSAIPGSDALIKLFNQLHDPIQISDLCSTFLNLTVDVKQEILETLDIEKRLEALVSHMKGEKDKLSLQHEIQSKMMERLSKDQREHLLREQLRTIHEELGESGGAQEDLKQKIENAGMTEEALKVAREEYARLSMVQRASPEYHVIRTYLDWLVSLPWNRSSGTETIEIELDSAKKILDDEHYGIDKAKKRIIQFLAVAKLKKDLKGPILCLLGPPGVGKTSIGQSIAKALGRNFIRLSLGGVRDEAEIRGHRRTYIGAMPGRIIQNIKRIGTKDPLIMLDEIDKIGVDFRGDPASALLEVLDPEQNHHFVDHYLDVAFDLSKSFFITTANVLETIPPALRDRLEVIEMTSYSRHEKVEIAKRHLIPKILTEHGIELDRVIFSDPLIEQIIESYTREAGVRDLSRRIADLARAKAEDIIRGKTASPITLTPEDLESALGPKKFFSESINDRTKPGTVTGLAWTPVGGQILTIEVTKMAGKGIFILTGQLGDVMKESAQIALSLIREQKSSLLPFKLDKVDFHIHVPSGAVPKDGPSAGIAIYIALLSLVDNFSLPSGVAFTGEITLRGNVLPVGGIKEKILAAHRAKVHTVFLPEQNSGDLKDISPDVLSQLKFHFIKDINEVTSRIIPKNSDAPLNLESIPLTH